MSSSLRNEQARCPRHWQLQTAPEVRAFDENAGPAYRVECDRPAGHEGRCYGWTPRWRRPSPLLAQDRP